MQLELKLKTGVFGKHNAQVGALGLTFMGLFWVWLVIRKAKRIAITGNDITFQSLFRKRIITKTEIASIDLLARGDGGFASSHKRVSGTLFSLHNFDKIFIPEQRYSNFGELKDMLKKNFANLVIPAKEVKPIPRTSTSDYGNAIKKYTGNALEQVIAESNWQVSNDLRISFKNNSTKTYGAGSLRDKTWKELIDKISSMGIPVACEV